MAEFLKVQDSLNSFTDTFKSLVIASKTKNDEPFSSYAPFVKYEGKYYFIMSKIAKHYENISEHDLISILFLEDESMASNVFFRKRLSYLTKTSFTNSEYVKNAFLTKFGEFVNMLFKMDFVIVECSLIKGSFVIGAGKAYEIDENQKIIKQMGGNGKGHQIGHGKDK
jgi:putative heme iron utilization protein